MSIGRCFSILASSSYAPFVDAQSMLYPRVNIITSSAISSGGISLLSWPLCCPLAMMVQSTRKYGLFLGQSSSRVMLGRAFRYSRFQARPSCEKARREKNLANAISPCAASSNARSSAARSINFISNPAYWLMIKSSLFFKIVVKRAHRHVRFLNDIGDQRIRHAFSCKADIRSFLYPLFGIDALQLSARQMFHARPRHSIIDLLYHIVRRLNILVIPQIHAKEGKRNPLPFCCIQPDQFAAAFAPAILPKHSASGTALPPTRLVPWMPPVTSPAA